MRLLDILENRNLGLTIFDIDETLFRTTAQIKVVKNGQVIRSLSNQEFNNYELQPGEDFDFGEFKDAQKFNRESIPILPMIAKLKAILRNAGDSKVIMLTARSDFDNKNLFLDTFRKYGIDIDKIHVHRAGNLGGSPAENKEVFIRQYLDTGDYARIRLYDDSMTNIRMFINLSKQYPNVKFFPYFVTHEGGIKTIKEDGRIVKGVNTTLDVGVNQIPIEAAKFGNKVDKDGKPPTLSSQVKGKSTNVLFNLGLAESIEPKTRRNYNEFVKHCCDFLELEQQPTIRLTNEIFDDTFGYFNSENDSITVSYNRRHQMDVMRTIAHELTHYRQRLDGEDLDGSDGSDHENEANAFAGVMLRQWADKHPHLFAEQKFTDYELALMEGGHMPETKPARTQGDLYTQLENFANSKKNESISGDEMLSTFQRIHHDSGMNPSMDKWVKSQEWGIDTISPNDIVEFEDLFDYDDPFDRIVDIDESQVRKYITAIKAGRQLDPIILGPQHKDGKYSIVDGNHRALAYAALGKDIPVYMPMGKIDENFADGKVKGKSRPGRVKRAGASCNGSVTDLRKRAKKYGGERGRMYHWCANMKSGRKKS